ncbi:PAS domain S-box protein, partial [Aestuariibaculum lutulentum]
MWNTSPDLMVVLSPDGIYRRINPAWQTVLGYAPEDVVGLYATDLTHADDLAATQAAFETAQAGTLPSFENRFRHKDGGYRWIQ